MTTMIPRGNLLNLYAIAVTFDPASVSTITTAEQDITIAGVKVGDIVVAVNKPSHTTGVTVGNARVKAANTVSVQFVNPTAGSVDAASETWTFVIGRPESVAASFNA